MPSNPDTNVVTSVSGKTGNVTLGKSDVGLGNVTNDAQVKRTEMGAASGVATLGTDGKVPSSQLPSYVDDVLEYAKLSSFPATGESGKIYVAQDTNKTYRWSGSAYVEISPSIVIGTTTGTAADGKTANDHYSNTSNPHSVTKAQVGLGNVGNFKAVSTVASQGLSSTEQANARANIGAGTSSFSGSYNDLSNKPSIPAAANNGTYTVKTLVGSTTTNVSDFTANQSSADDVTFVQGSNVTITPDATNRKITIAAKDTTYSEATTSAAGLMSSSDKTKLNGIESGAQVHKAPTAAEVKSALGTGSGTSKYLREDGTWVTPPNDNTTYSSKAAASGGTDVSLVTTGEKYTWNNKTSNTGTVTSVAASGSGGISVTGGPITTSGTLSIGIDLSTAINGLSVGTSEAQRDDYIVAQYTGGGTTTTTYHRRKLSNIFAALSKSDVTTALGYTPPTADTNTWRPISDSVSSTDSSTSASSKAVKAAYDLAASKTSNTGTVTKVTAGTGLTGGDITTTGTIALATSGVTAGTYKRVTVDAYGRVTSGDNTDADTDTHRPIQVNGTEILGNNTTALNLKAGTNVSLSNSGGTVTITATDTNTWRPVSDAVNSTDSGTAASSKAVKTAYDLAASKTSNTGTVTSVAAGTGLSGGTITTSGTLSVAYGTTAGTACQGNDSRLSNSRPASDVYSWAKASSKPTYIANEVMSISAQSISANTSSSCSITGSGNAGKAQTIIYVNGGSSDVTVTVPTTYSTPNGEAIELTCPVGGYCEVSYLNIGGTIYARGL